MHTLQFAYAGSNLDGVSSYTFTVDMETEFGTEEELDGVSFYVAAHAVVENSVTGQNETAWGAGERITGRGSWATFFIFTLASEDGDGPLGGTETAFAYGGEYAINLNSFDFVNANRWGWTNGPLAEGTYSFDIYAGAGQNDLTKGTLVGTLAVNYDGSVATVTYTMNAGYTMDETHLHAGSEPLARDRQGNFTVAPGQYGIVDEDLVEATTATYVVTGLSGEIYVVAHAVVSGEF